MSSCPNNSWINLKSTPFFNKCEANEWRNLCGDISFFIPACLTFSLIKVQEYSAP